MSEEVAVYAPKPGSMTWRIVKFLIDNPDEELTRGDMVVKFDASSASVDALLQLPVARGVLKKTRNSENEIVWMRGASNRYDMGKEPEQPQEQAPAPMPFLVPTRPDDGLPVIRKNQPLMGAKDAREQQLLAWLAEFEVRSSAEFPITQLTEIRTAAKRYSRAHGTKFRFAETGPGRWGMERRA